MTNKRGIVISPPFHILPTGGIQIGGYPSSFEVRKHLLYWDKIDYPHNNHVSIAVGPDLDFLIQEGIAARTEIVYPGTLSITGGRFEIIGQKLIEAQQKAFQLHEEKEPGVWSIAQLSTACSFVNAQSLRAIEFELYNMLPVPKDDTPLCDILEFKNKRPSELIAVREYLDALYLSVCSSNDVPRAKNAAMNKLEQALKELDKVLYESKIQKVWTSLRGYLYNGLDSAIGGAGLASSIGMDISHGALIGFALKSILLPPQAQRQQPLAYISSIKEEWDAR